MPPTKQKLKNERYNFKLKENKITQKEKKKKTPQKEKITIKKILMVTKKN